MSSTLTPQDNQEEKFDDELKPGTELLHGQYVIEHFLNNGGFGITYLAKDSLLRLVVIKECFPEAICRRTNATVRARSRDQAEAFRTIVDLFIEEARGLARLSHPNIVGVHQVFEDNDTAYIAMDFVEGRDLLEIAETEATIPPRDLEAIAYKLLDAVAFIHGEGVLHRDIAPDNILLGKDNEPVLIDFGAARETVTRDTSYLADLRTVKDGYSPQEFYIKDSEQHPSSDLYSLAASLYHVMTNELPVSAQVRMTAIAAGEPDPYVPVKERASGYTEPFLKAIDHALQLFPKDRIQSAAEWRASIAKGSAPEDGRGPGSRPVLASDNGNLIGQFARKTSIFTSRMTSTKQSASRAEQPISETVDDLDDPTRSQSEVAHPSSSPNAKSKGKGLYVGVAAVALIAVIGAGSFFFVSGSNEGGTTSTASSGSDTFDPENTLASGVGTEGTQEANRPEQLPFFLADSSSGDVIVSSAGGSRLTASETGPLVAPQRPNAPTASQPLGGAGAVSDLAAAQPQPSGISLANISSTAPVDTRGLSPVISGAAVEFRVTPDSSDPSIVQIADGPLSEHLSPGLRVVSINGFPLSTLRDFQRVVDATTDYEAGDSVSIAVGIENPGTGETYVRDVDLPSHQKTMLLNGVEFQTVKDGDNWITSVTAGSGAGEADLRVGDQLIALMPNNELIDGQQTLVSLMQRELDAGSTQFNFAVTRNGEMWLVSMPYSGAAGE